MPGVVRPLTLRWLLSAPATLCLFTILKAPVSANGPEIGREAGLVVPLTSSRVQLLSEDVRIHLPEFMGHPGQCDCRYTLRNSTDSVAEFEMAFLLNPFFEQEQLPAWYRDAEFQVRIDTRDVPVRWEPIARDLWQPFIEMAPESLPVWSVSIAPRETVTVFMTHRIGWSGGSEGGAWGIEFTYRATPAQLWAGSIERASICFGIDGLIGRMLSCLPDSTECYEFSISPPGYRFTAAGICWEYRDWEPEEDNTISFGFGR